MFDLTNKRFGKLVAQYVVNNGHGRRWKCQCDCGSSTTAVSYDLRTGHSKSCGCLRYEPVKHGHTSRRKGKSPTYRSWQSMIGRCLNPSDAAHAHYQSRGITVCKRWRRFENFLTDMGVRPVNTTLDRENNDKGYYPGNVRWATKRIQGNNRITNLHFIYCGKKYTLADLARETGVSKDILRARLCKSNFPWTVEGAVKTPKLTRSSQGFYC